MCCLVIVSHNHDTIDISPIPMKEPTGGPLKGKHVDTQRNSSVWRQASKTHRVCY